MTFHLERVSNNHVPEIFGEILRTWNLALANRVNDRDLNEQNENFTDDYRSVLAIFQQTIAHPSPSNEFLVARDLNNDAQAILSILHSEDKCIIHAILTAPWNLPLKGVPVPPKFKPLVMHGAGSFLVQQAKDEAAEKQLILTATVYETSRAFFEKMGMTHYSGDEYRLP